MIRKLFPMRRGRFKDGLLQLVDTIEGSNLLTLQIGSYAGESAQIFLSSGKFAKIYCIDPWENGYDIQDQASFTNDLAEEFFDRRFSKDPRVVKIKGYSFNEVPKLADGYFDFIYVDGSHKKEDVYRDLQIVFPKLKATGLLAGHDYGPLHRWSGVMEAVDEFLLRKPEHTFQDFSWCCKKESIQR